jgi:hypothetical protein
MVGTAQPLCLSASETEGRRYEMTMNLGKSEITAPHYNAGLDDEMPSSRRGSVFLDIPFYRTGFSEKMALELRLFTHAMTACLRFQFDPESIDSEQDSSGERYLTHAYEN